MIISLFAVDEEGGMGNNGTIPWPFNKEDMTWFKSKTQGQVVIMGKKSWDSPDMIKPLPKRHNVVFTNNFFDDDRIDQIRGDVCEGIFHIQKKFDPLDVYVIGGANILIQAKPIIKKSFITRIPGKYNCDTKIDLGHYLKDCNLVSTFDLGTCIVEEYETI
jgi:dihydrofolate reductase